MAGLDAATGIDSDLADVLDDLDGLGWIPGMDLILAGIAEAARAAAEGRVDLDGTQTLLTGLSNPHGPDVTAAVALLIRHLTNPVYNRALDRLDRETAKKVQLLGEIHVFEMTELAPRSHPVEAAGLIAPD